jgi:hypothetical protein
MRDSINYNLNYFIMRMSGTKPMKNTMRKQSPIRMANIVGATVSAGKKALDLAVSAKKAKATKTKATTETSAKTPPIQMKKYNKKC